MIARILVTLVVLGFAIGAFCGAGPTRMGLFDPFGIFFLFVAAFVWFKWHRLKPGFDRPVMDDIAQSYWGPDGGSGPKVPEPDDAGPRRRR